MTNKPENEEDNSKKILIHDKLIYVHLPYENVYGSVVSQGIWSSVVEYNKDGIGYRIEVPNDEFDVVQEIDLSYFIEKDENL